ncbi:hypothetical protein V6M85_05905 [Sulfolobus tengchongensis]|uniref:Thermopsin n=1 Tax=Sulfolobus tengchongensis TaxID=207809 RepID=A0AAX4L336_9CREN
MKWKIFIITLLIISLFPLMILNSNEAEPLPLSPLQPSDLQVNFYDEQLFMMLNLYPTTTSLVAYVNVVAQASNSGYGPAYLLNAITNNCWWYQVGVAYNWPYTNGSFNPGFHMIYMVWNSSGDPVIGPVLLNFNGPVNSGDQVTLKIYLSNGNIVLCAHDDYTRAEASVSINANGASSIVTSLNLRHGYITGLMTEWYHLRPYYGGETGVIYRLQYFASSFTLGINEFATSSTESQVSAFRTVEYNVQNNYTFYNLSYIGAFEASNGYYFVTGDLYPIFLNYKIIGGNFSVPINATYLYYGYKDTTTLPSLIFVDANSNIDLPTLVQKGLSRIISLNNTPVEATRSGNLTLYYQLQYYLNVNIPVNASINGVFTTLTSGWYNASVKITVSPFTYYKNDSRIMVSSYPTNQFVLNGPINLTIKYILQYYIQVNSPTVVFGEINGTNSSISSGWYTQSTLIQIYNITFYENNETRTVIVKILPSNRIFVNASYVIYVEEVIQYYITVKSPIPIYALINGTNQTLVSNWYNKGTTIYIENTTFYGPNNEFRCIIGYTSPSNNITVEEPLTIVIGVVRQYPVHVKSPIPIYALINGTNETLPKFSWINNGTRIQVENITYYLNKTYRLLIKNILPYPIFIVNHPINMTIITVPQYYLNVDSNYPVYICLNGINTTLNSGWYNNWTKIQLYRIWYLSQVERQYLINVYINGRAINYTQLIIDEPISLKIIYVIQYYINITSNIPIQAIVNNTLITFTPGWYAKGTPILFVNNTYYASNTVRYITLAITPMNFTVNRSVVVKVVTLKEYLVTINMPIPITINNKTINTSEIWITAGEVIMIPKYINISNNEQLFYNTTSYTINVTKPLNVSVNAIREYLVTINGISEWLPTGTILTLTQSVPIYEQGKWIGTYNLSNGGAITVNEPITEIFVENINGLFVGGIVLIVAIIILIVLYLMIRKSKPKF